MILVTCAALALAFTQPASAGKTFELTEDCPARIDSRVPDKPQAAFRLMIKFDPPVTVLAGRHTVRGLVLLGPPLKETGGLIWKGGTLKSPTGDGNPYKVGFNAAQIGPGATNVQFIGVNFTDAMKAIGIHKANNISVVQSRFSGAVMDVLDAVDTDGIVMEHNVASDMLTVQTACTLANGKVIAGLLGAECRARGGVWVDGWHSDFAQLRAGTRNVVIRFNRIDMPTGQGGGQMAPKTDAPLSNVLFEGNEVVSRSHPFTLYDCNDCVIRNNRARKGHLWAAKFVHTKADARSCGNVADAGPLRQRCK